MIENQPYLQKQTIKSRNPNIDFIRISGMFSIVFYHLIYHGKAKLKFRNYNGIQLLNIFCMWNVSCFGMISGLVASKAHKFSNLFYLWIIAVFYSLIFFMKYNNLKTIVNFEILRSYIFPIIYRKYWYLTAYFGIYPFLPFINSSISIISRIQFKKSIYFMLAIFIIWSSYYQDSFAQQNGKSPFSLLIFYVFGAYIRKYIFYKVQNTIYKILICFICLSIFLMVTFSCYKFNISKSFYKLDSNIKNIFRIEINSLPMIFQTFAITISIAQIQFGKFISRMITFIGPLSFDIYLIHDNPLIRRRYVINSFNNYSYDMNLMSIFLIIVIKSIIIFTICIIIAFIRNKIFIKLKIKNMCDNIEIIITKLINNFI